MKNNAKSKTISAKEIILGLLGIAAIVFIMLQFASPSKMQPSTKPKIIKVKYTVICDECDVTYTTPSGTEMKSSVNSDWKFTYRAHRGNTPYISAQNKKESGQVKVFIWLNGKMIKHAESEGPYVIAQADAYIN